MLNNKNILIQILITIILCVSSLGVVAKSFDYPLKSSTILIKSVISVASNTHQNCDETKDSSCLSSAFIAIFQALGYSPNLFPQKQKEYFIISFDSILLEVPKRPPRSIKEFTYKDFLNLKRIHKLM
jgi:hypothetical protein|tara:strand:+ start:695 stop:1075 length:381 start_codon:yes stop_codon:yes gene_type:complete